MKKIINSQKLSEQLEHFNSINRLADYYEDIKNNLDEYGEYAFIRKVKFFVDYHIYPADKLSRKYILFYNEIVTKVSIINSYVSKFNYLYIFSNLIGKNSVIIQIDDLFKNANTKDIKFLFNLMNDYFPIYMNKFDKYYMLLALTGE